MYAKVGEMSSRLQRDASGFVFGPVIIGALADLTGGGNLAGVAFNVAILFVASFFFWIVSRGMRRES